MSQNPYAGYGGNPYAANTSRGDSYASNAAGRTPDATNTSGGNPYAAETYERVEKYDSNATSVYDATPSQLVAGPQYGQSPASAPAPRQQGSTALSDQDFLSRVNTIKADIRTLTTQISSIGSAHQRLLSSSDGATSSTIENLTTQTQVLNTRIKDQIKFLETDAARSGGNNSIKNSQVKQLKSSFSKQLEDYKREESGYRHRYREQIARQFRIVNPDATESEVREAQDADWGDEGVFQTALKTNRSATATTVLGAVRSRHNDIARIERTMVELEALFRALAEEVEAQDPTIRETERQTEQVAVDTEKANVQLGIANEHARRTRKLKWICAGITLLILLIVGLVVGLVIGLRPKVG